MKCVDRIGLKWTKGTKLEKMDRSVLEWTKVDLIGQKWTKWTKMYKMDQIRPSGPK